MGKLEHGGYEVLILMEYCGGNKATSVLKPYNLDDQQRRFSSSYVLVESGEGFCV